MLSARDLDATGSARLGSNQLQRDRRCGVESSRACVKKQVIEHLGQLDFLHARQNVILLGPPGTGKTHISIALGVRACLAGQRVVFRTATEWVALLGEAQRRDRLDEELDRLERIPLLICDEVGYIPFDPQAASLMFMLVSRRYERASLIVTSNKPFSALGRDLRRRHGRRRDGRPAHPRRRTHLAQRRQLPAQRPRPRTPPNPTRGTPPNRRARRHFTPLAYGSLRKTPAPQPSTGLLFDRREPLGGSILNRP